MLIITLVLLLNSFILKSTINIMSF